LVGGFARLAVSCLDGDADKCSSATGSQPTRAEFVRHRIACDHPLVVRAAAGKSGSERQELSETRFSDDASFLLLAIAGLLVTVSVR
jgi:hypothetical protein